MGKTNGLVGGVTGKMGNLIGYYRRGNYLVRAYNPHTTNVRSRLQQRQRARWIALMNLLRPAIKTLRVGFHFDTPGYELPNAMKENMSNVTAMTATSVEINYNEIQLSKGKFEGWGNAGAITSDNGVVEIGFIKEEGWENSLPSDYGSGSNAILQLAVYSVTEDKWFQTIIGYNEVNNKITVTLPPIFVTTTCHFYAFLACPPVRVLGDGIPDYCSNTVYLGSATVE
jgi:hypothetical protein